MTDNFFINGLGFQKAISAERPYERATAPFRKEQMDTTPTVGDQSLAGWWTRGQMSFHEGAGIKYYEVLDGQEVLNRFQDSSGVNPWEPGEVRLDAGLTRIGLSGVTDAVGGSDFNTSAAGVFALVGGSLRFVSSAPGATYAPVSGGNILAITTSGTGLYYATSAAVEGPQEITSTVTNYWTNPRWYAGGSTGTSSAEVDATHQNGSLLLAFDESEAVEPSGGPHTFTVEVVGLTNGSTYRIIVDCQSASGDWELRVNGAVLHDGPAAKVDTTFVAAGTTATVVIDMGTGLAGSFAFRELSLTNDFTGPSVNPHDNPTWQWTGTPNASRSQFTQTVGLGDRMILWQPLAGRSWVNTWWAKGRLFAVDDLGRFFQLTAVGGTTANEHIFWSSRQSGAGWSMAESPGPIYLAKGGVIYALTPDAQGDIPLLTTPVVAGTLPTGEVISSLYFYLGKLVICSNAGVRVAEVGPSGEIGYGSPVIRGDFSASRRINGLGDVAYVVGRQVGDTAPSVFVLNLAMAAGESTAPFARRREVAAGGALGVTVSPALRLYAFDGLGFLAEAPTLAASGYVQTALHRLGTLEPKFFNEVKVKVEGVGQVAVSAVLPDGASVSVGTITAPASADLDLRSAAGGNPVEYLALRFTLTPTGGESPALLGYQLRALPVPRRQRLIRVPLKLFDSETHQGRAAGAPRSAWSRLEALEEAEAGMSMVQYRDTETGEAGTAYVESVDFNRTNPAPQRGGSGFGGIVHVTLRKVG
ncbi:hypothetical protein [Nocardioides massiliensis]|uniref:Uncharacterized protein n=1 Tax=Nocardioides massiliensis TaxID=1325935 RepID=A0ABT9NJ94_9ACTN|nr:hypothetical protein [Nocardioides massiliensis]MDP9820493.1 hypothetical protein [Nocardioides massiliensis]